MLQEFPLGIPVKSLEIGARRRRRSHDVSPQLLVPEPFDDRPQPVWPLDMEGRGNVVQEPRVVDDHDRRNGGPDFKASSADESRAASIGSPPVRAKVFSSRSKSGLRAGDAPDPPREPSAS